MISSTLCIIKLILKVETEISNTCKKIVDSRVLFPMAEYLANGQWLVSTKTQIQFDIECDQTNDDLKVIKTLLLEPPMATLKLTMSCTGYSGHMSLPPFLNKESRYNISDSIVDFVRSYKMLNHKLWLPFKTALAEYQTIKIPKKLEIVKDEPLDNLIRELSEVHTELEPMNISSSFWHYIG